MYGRSIEHNPYGHGAEFGPKKGKSKGRKKKEKNMPEEQIKLRRDKQRRRQINKTGHDPHGRSR